MSGQSFEGLFITRGASHAHGFLHAFGLCSKRAWGSCEQAQTGMHQCRILCQQSPESIRTTTSACRALFFMFSINPCMCACIYIRFFGAFFTRNKARDGQYKHPSHECAHSSWMRTYMHIYIIAHFMFGDLETKILPQCKMTSENINDIVEFVYM